MLTSPPDQREIDQSTPRQKSRDPESSNLSVRFAGIRTSTLKYEIQIVWFSAYYAVMSKIVNVKMGKYNIIAGNVWDKTI
ncbi:hypothetical protein TNIN_431971 [Trichonephila inaurata madagascariensis]|uniref:Uncharacterized protein n=1 Tax=Trichonephila inaurata madagascariensis TaxID=2747483 RepID=A0A8X6XYI2_9ARAC|nr:hypothetical protein TNIN_431971 [Trichonephila inaurata madagascariensis]